MPSLPSTPPSASHTTAARRRREDAAERPIASALPLDGEHVLSINESHERCAALGLSRIGQPDYSPIGRADFTITRERNRRLFTHAAPVMELLFEQIVKTQSMVVLTDSQGTILHSIGDEDFLEKAGKVALAPGVNWAECTKGTNGIGTALVDERSMLVHADEHFMHANHFLTCQASPILDPRGNILGVLDVSGDRRGYHHHTMGLVKMSARMIENHWLNDDFSDALRLHFHPRLEFIGTLMEGILAVDADGRILGANRSSLDLLGLSGAALRMHTVDSLLGTPMGLIADQGRVLVAAPMRMNLPNGSPVYVQVRCNWPLWQGQRAPSGQTPAGKGIEGPFKYGHAFHDASVDPHGVAPGLQATAKVSADTVGTQAEADHAPVQPAEGFARLLTGDAQVAAVVAKLKRVQNRDIAVLVLGEAGSGKEALARAIHHESRRAAKPFVSVQCASTSEAALEAELFGYAEGVFGGTRRQGAPGKLAQANGGTLFLDEVGGLPVGLQARLLRALQDKRVTPLGSPQSQPIDVALVSATDRNPRELIDGHAIREDLYYRLNGLAVRLPALRERTDLMALVRKWLVEESPSRPLQLAPDVEQLLTQYDWPGNLRQLANVLHTAAVMAQGEARITREHLADDFLEEARQRTTAATPPVLPAAAPAGAHPGARTLDELGRDAIRQAVEAAGGNISVASKRLGISRNTIYRKLRW
jgi:transcriptional regulator of acetoin/glycerol metabolism